MVRNNRSAHFRCWTKFRCMAVRSAMSAKAKMSAPFRLTLISPTKPLIVPLEMTIYIPLKLIRKAAPR